MHIETFEIADRFCGPPRSGNGGYVCGKLASQLVGVAAVRLKLPPPLNALLRLESASDSARLFHGEQLVGEAKLAALDIVVPPSPTFAQAQESSQQYLGFKRHAFPSCFVCGPNREHGDGLRIFPGAVGQEATIAAPWTPHESLGDAQGMVKPEFLWSALDCTGAFAFPNIPEGMAIVLGELAVSIENPLRCGDACVVIGWPLGEEGRKHFAGSAIYTQAGVLVAKARAVWIEVPASTWS